MYQPTNTHILVPEFEYERPETLDQVFSLLDEHGATARLIAGGTDLLVQMKLERTAPACLISLDRVEELGGIADDDGLVIGATTAIRDLAACEPARRGHAALVEACRSFSTTAISVMGTVGGNLCNASPAADTAPPLLVFDASAIVVSRQGERRLPLEEFFTGPGETALGEGEILRAVHLAEPAPGTASAFLKIARVEADIAKVNAAVALTRDGLQVAQVAIALGAVAPVPMRARRAEAALAGRAFDTAALAEATQLVEEEIASITDVRATAEYRKHASGVIVRDALTIAWRRAGGGEPH
jgi:carbon-monoxide dehydrogenase medium subunit